MCVRVCIKTDKNNTHSVKFHVKDFNDQRLDKLSSSGCLCTNIYTDFNLMKPGLCLGQVITVPILIHCV